MNIRYAYKCARQERMIDFCVWSTHFSLAHSVINSLNNGNKISINRHIPQLHSTPIKEFKNKTANYFPEEVKCRVILC